MKILSLILLLSTAILAMEDDSNKNINYNELYRKKYNKSYDQASKMNTGLGPVLLLRSIDHVTSKGGLIEESFDPKFDAITDVLNGRPNKLKK